MDLKDQLKSTLLLIISISLFSCSGKKVLVKTRTDLPDYNYTDPSEYVYEFYVEDKETVYQVFVPVSSKTQVQGVVGKVADSLANINTLKHRVGQSDTLKVILVKSKIPVTELKTIKDSLPLKDGDVITVYNEPAQTEEINLIRQQMGFWKATRKTIGFILKLIAVAIVIYIGILIDRWKNR